MVDNAHLDEFDIKMWDGDPDDVTTSLVHSSKNVLSGGNIKVHKKQGIRVLKKKAGV